MSTKEHFHSIKSFDNGRVRLNLPLDSTMHEFVVNTTDLTNLAHFLGFSRVSILPKEFLMDSESDREITSIVKDDSNQDTVLKKRWKAIQMYLDLDKIKRDMKPSVRDSDLAHRIDHLIRQELLTRGKEQLSAVSQEHLILLDIIPTILIAIVSILALRTYGIELSQEELAFLVMGSFILKTLFSNVHSLAHAISPKDMARLTLLEGTQADRLLTSTLKAKKSVIWLNKRPQQ